jgi:pyruvate-formate lyase-activating enzyme
MGFLQAHRPLVPGNTQREADLKALAEAIASFEKTIAARREYERQQAMRAKPKEGLVGWQENLPLYEKEAVMVVIPERGGDPED